jgi:divinyl chlorophyllide a 8-vinyl-reductase
MDDVKADFEGADCRFGDVTNIESLRSVAFKDKVDVVVSCLASRTGGVQDSWDIDYQASLVENHMVIIANPVRSRRAKTA